MPVYTYQVIHDDDSEGEEFDHVQSMNEDPLTEHPETGEKVVRVFRSTHIASSSNERIQKQNTSDENLGRLGFTKYVRNGKGNYEKHVGAGPDSLHAND